MEIDKILEMYNEKHMTLVDIAKELSSSKSSLSRLLAKEGYVFNKSLKQYIHETENTANSETSNKESNKSVKNVSRETIEPVKCTFALPPQLYKALKIKCAVEDIKMVDLVKETLEKVIEKKYFDM